MSRNPLIEAIHEARYDLETSAPNQRAACRGKLDVLVQKVLTQANSKVTARELLNILHDDYKIFRRMKRRQEWPKL